MEQGQKRREAGEVLLGEADSRDAPLLLPAAYIGGCRGSGGGVRRRLKEERPAGGRGI